MLHLKRCFNVETLTIVQRWKYVAPSTLFQRWNTDERSTLKICCIFNVVSTLKYRRTFNVENMLHLQRCFNVEKTSMLQRWNLNVESTLNYSCSTLQPIFNLFSTLKQRCVPAGFNVPLFRVTYVQSFLSQRKNMPHIVPRLKYEDFLVKWKIVDWVKRPTNKLIQLCVCKPENA